MWLLSLISYTGKHPKLVPLLPEIQEAFSHLLGDQNELTQEMASRGMSVVYSLGDESARKQLLDGLMGVLSGTAAMELASACRMSIDGFRTHEKWIMTTCLEMVLYTCS